MARGAEDRLHSGVLVLPILASARLKPLHPFQDSDEYKALPRIQQLWVDLSVAVHDMPEGESVLARHTQPPWELDDPKVAAAWEALTAPENLEDLLKWGEPELNPRARECTDRAIEACRRRRKAVE